MFGHGQIISPPTHLVVMRLCGLHDANVGHALASQLRGHPHAARPAANDEHAVALPIDSRSGLCAHRGSYDAAAALGRAAAAAAARRLRGLQQG